MSLTVEQVEKTFLHGGRSQAVLRSVDLEVRPGEFVCLIGHSGCGKSTLVRAIGGLLPVDRGRIALDGQPVTAPGPDRAMVFQHYSLLPRLSLLDNVRHAVRASRPEWGRARADAAAERYLAAVGLTEHHGKRPAQVSGGMQQRAAVARAFAVEPRALLLDEPFGALDALTRARLQAQLIDLWRSESDTEIVLMVTHGIDEAILLADRIVVMGNGPGPSVIDVIPVDLPRPRDRVSVIDEPAYRDVQARLLALLMRDADADTAAARRDAAASADDGQSLAGWTVAVTADRRADDQAEMLRARGATILMVPMLATGMQGDDELVATTAELLLDPPDLLVGTTAVGMRAWLASAWARGLGSSLVDTLGSITLVARGTKAAGAFLSEGLEVSWRAPGETLSEVLEYLLGQGVDGLRIAVQRHGGDCSWFMGALEAAGAEVVEVAVYHWLPPASPEPGRRLLDAVARGGVDALTFTSPPAAAELARLGGPALLDQLDQQRVVSVCVGPVTAARAVGAGLPHVVSTSPSRLGPMIGTLTEVLTARAHHVELAGVTVRVQGSHLVVGDRVERLTPRERALLEVLLGSRGAVISKRTASERAWGGPAGDHTVEVTVNRLRGKLGPAAEALETRNRRGYRLATAL